MTAEPSIRLSLAIALQGAQANLADILTSLPQDPDLRYEILLCHAADDPLPPDLPAREDMRPVVGVPGALIPELWRDGFVAAQGGWVATLTAHCLPGPDWLRRAFALITQDSDEPLAAFGGAIVAPLDADRVAQAIQLLRYADAGPGLARHRVSDVSADNALYLRKAVLDCSDLLGDGFWEPNYHRRFLAGGMVMEMIPDLVVTHRNRYSAVEFMRQRRRHGRVFGRHRSSGSSRWMQWARLLASPAAFPIFAFKQTRKVLSRPVLRAEFLPSAFWFYAFMANWCWGEIIGYSDALRANSKGSKP